jgi:hypothetical protein
VDGSAGTASGDEGSVTVDLYSGGSASGTPVQTVVAPRDATGAFSARFGAVAGGTYSVRARQADAAGNTGLSGATSFVAAGPPPPDFAVFSTEESLADASAGRITALTGCEGDCRRSTSLRVSSKAAARLGLPRRGRRSVRLGRGSQGAGAGGVRVRLTRAARAALGDSSGTPATLQAVAGSVKLSHAITLRPSLRPARIASRGLRLAGVCSTSCSMSARLIVSATTARRLGIRTSGGAVAIGSGRASGVASRPVTFTARVARSVRAALSRARGADLTLEVTVTGNGTASRRATRRITLG